LEALFLKAREETHRFLTGLLLSPIHKTDIISGRECSKKHALSLSKGSARLREAAPAKAGNATGFSAVALAKAGGLFQPSLQGVH